MNSRWVPAQQAIDALVSRYGAGDFAATEQLARAMTRQYPKFAFAWKVLGAALSQAGRLQDALGPMRQAALLEPGDAQTHLNIAVTLSFLGQMQQAVASCRDALSIKPDYVEAHGNLGSFLFRLGDLAQAEASFRAALNLRPDQAEIHGNLGDVLSNLERLSESEQHYREALRIRPDYAAAHHGLGSILRQRGQLAQAEASFREAARLRPGDAETLVDLANVQRALGQSARAEASYRAAIHANPDYAPAYNHLGSYLNQIGRKAEAEACCREALRLKPDFADARNNLGNVLIDLAQAEQAEANFREAIRLQPGLAEAYSNLGKVLRDTGRLTQAEASYRDAIRLKPDLAVAYANLGDVLKSLGRLERSEAACREAIRLDPNYAEAWNMLGITLTTLGRLEEAEACFRTAIRLTPRFAEAHSNLLFGLNYVGALPVEAALEEAESYGAAVSPRALPKFTSWLADTKPAKLRVGFVSGDFNQHPVGYFAEGLFQHLDGAQFELVAFPSAAKSDVLTERIRPRFLDWVPIYGKNDAEAAALIHERGVHVLVDLSGHTANNRLPVFAFKPAPVQASWLGYFASTGLPEMDYFLGDPYMSPEHEHGHFTEQILRLPDTWLCLAPPAESGLIAQPPLQQNRYPTFGNFSNLSKIGPEVVETWAGILQRVPEARLFLKAKQLSDASAMERVCADFAGHGIPAHRLILEGPSPRPAYLEAYNRVDLVLDTFPYPGGTTSIDALWMGVPLVTLQGARFLSHLGESIAHNAGHPEWIAADRSGYADKAVALAADAATLGEIRRGMRSGLLRSPLFDVERFAQGFGQALWTMFRETYQSG